MNTRVREYVPKNYISSGLYKSFASFCFLQMIMGSCRVDTRNRYVTHPSSYQKAFSILIIISTGCMYAIGQVNYITRYRDEYTLYLLGSTLLISHYTCYVINILQLRFFNNDTNVKFVIKMQEIDRLMKIDRNKRFNDILRKLNNAAILFLLFAFSLYVGSAAYGASSGTAVVLTAASGIGESIMLADLVLCSNIIQYFIMRIRFVNSIIANHLKEHCALETQFGNCFKSNSFMRKLAAKTHEFRSCNTDVYIKEIMKGFYQFNNLYQSQVI
ncbi:uncharacterized protein LOC114358634 [Ostrinia furnacalis]|uniref:uncharacterized protein LOC114358634 n=1 Tax=Ostrinia furnacalis TaxID=93504 RepID=UPI00103948F6|nr:uncharacterized protein LOC114358634 [Ostrinia furnacalis]